MTVPWYYAPGALSALALGMACMTRSRRLGFSAGVLLSDWGFATLLAGLTGTQYDWAWLALIDCLAAWVLVIPHRRMEAVLSVSYAIEMLVHISYGIEATFFLRPSDAWGTWHAQSRDWTILFVIACLQALLLVFWGLSNGGRRRSRLYRHIFPSRLGRAAEGYQGALLSDRGASE